MTSKTMTAEHEQALRWAHRQNFTSAAARYAKLCAEAYDIARGRELMTGWADQLQAVSQMGGSLHEYNRGVLAMLGKEQLAVNHRADCAEVAWLVRERDALDESAFSEPHSEEWVRLSSAIGEATRRVNASWEPIQALIDEALRLRG